jgi:hypothetical protein
MTYMRIWKSHRLTSHTWIGLNPQIGRPQGLSVPLVYFYFYLNSGVLKNTRNWSRFVTFDDFLRNS